MSKELKTPEFKSEAEEAQWWTNNQKLLLGEFEQAAEASALNRSDKSTQAADLDRACNHWQDWQRRP